MPVWRSIRAMEKFFANDRRAAGVTRDVKRIAFLVVVVTVTGVAWDAVAADSVRVSLAGARPVLTVGGAWTARLTVRPVSFRGVVRVSATGPKRIDALASGGRGAYRVRLVFTAAGRWTLTARAGTSTSLLGSVQVGKAAPTPLAFVWPTSVEPEPGGSLLLVENGLRRLLRVHPATGRVTEIASFTKPYAVERAPSGSIFVNDGPFLRRIDGTKASTSSPGPTGTSAQSRSRRTATSTTRRRARSGSSPAARESRYGSRRRRGYLNRTGWRSVPTVRSWSRTRGTTGSCEPTQRAGRSRRSRESRSRAGWTSPGTERSTSSARGQATCST
jgi:hypothetical protein